MLNTYVNSGKLPFAFVTFLLPMRRKSLADYFTPISPPAIASEELSSQDTLGGPSTQSNHTAHQPGQIYGLQEPEFAQFPIHMDSPDFLPIDPWNYEFKEYVEGDTTTVHL